MCSINKESNEASLLRRAILIVWDEAPMMNTYCFEVVNRLLQDIMGNRLPFGGKLVIFGGDF
jgi:ATP-dependent DNA helicase PIF1